MLRYFLFKNKVLNVPDEPADPRDWELGADLLAKSESTGLEEFSRRYSTLEVKNQGSIGSCVGHSGRVVYGDTLEFSGKEPSPMWIYKNGKKHDLFPGEGYSGTTIRGASTALLKLGCCEEKYWPDLKSEDAPMLEGAEENAADYKINAYYIITSSNHYMIKKALTHEPLWTSFKVHKKFYYTGSDGIVKSEGYLESEFRGGHAVAMIGWKTIDGKLYWEFQNSWGTYFGDEGHFFMEASLYEKVLMNSVGPYYLAVKSEKGNGKFLDPEEERKKKEIHEKKKKDKKKNKLMLIIGGAVFLGFAAFALL